MSDVRARIVRRLGMTLVEVVAGLALLATLMVALLSVKAQVARQHRQAAARRAMVSAAEQLLAGWWPAPATFPRLASGVTPGGFTWRTHILPPAAIPVGNQVVRLEIGDNSGAQVSVDVLLPTPAQTRAGPPR